MIDSQEITKAAAKSACVLIILTLLCGLTIGGCCGGVAEYCYNHYQTNNESK